MKKEILIIITFFFCSALFGQTFKQYKKTRYFFTTINNQVKTDPGQTISYIKRGDTILVLEKQFLQDFLSLFEKNAAALDSLFAKIHFYKRDMKAEMKIDKVLSKTKFKIYNTIHVLNTGRGVSWRLMTGYGLHPCYFNIVFKTNSDLLFFKVEDDGCEL